jgi:glycosyltransferase involved in cell wall biosynthesis
VVLEAMAAGRPVVASDAPGGLRDIVDHETTGLVVPVGDAAAAARALRRLVEDPETRRRLGANGRARCVQHFSAARMVEQVTAPYETALARRHAAEPTATPKRARAQD